MNDRGDRSPITRFVGVGIDEYENEKQYPCLPEARKEAQQIAELLTGLGVDATVTTETSERELDAELEDLLRPPVAGPLVVLWAGHADRVPDAGLRLVASNTVKEGTPLLTPERVMSMAARSGASQILLIFDTCYSGSGAVPAVRNADAVFGDYPDPQRRVWLGIVTSAMDWQKARDDLFGRVLAQLLRDGPTRTPRVDLRLQWSGKQAAIRGNALIETLLDEWDEDAPHQLKVVQYGNRSEDLLPNPLHDPHTPETTVDSLVRAARGESDDEQAYFTGRKHVLERLISWIRQARTGLALVTGPPGCGKSAVLGMLLRLSVPMQRSAPLNTDLPQYSGAGEFAIEAYLSAHRLARLQLVRAIDHQLSDRGVLDADRRGRRDIRELVDAVRASGRRPVIVVDGLDEAGLEAWPIADDVLRPLARYARVVVGTRDVTPPDRTTPLVARLQPDESAVIHLPDEVDDAADIHAYILKRLTGANSSAMDPNQVANAVRELLPRSTDGRFLFAKLLAAQLREEPIDTGQPDWQERLATTVDKTFQRNLDALPDLVRGTDKLPHAGFELLSALAWAQGAGLPDDIWPVVATALSTTDTTYSRDDAYWALTHASKFIVEDSEVDHAGYRLAHQQLADHLRERVNLEHPELRVATALSGKYAELMETGVRANEPVYLWRYFWRHCADAGPAGMDLLRSFAERDRTMFLPDVALANRYLSERFFEIGQPGKATAAAEESVEIYRTVTEEQPVHLADLAIALEILAARYDQAGRWVEAVALADEVVEHRRCLAAADPAFRPELADALSQLANRYAENGRWQEAVAHAEEAAEHYRGMVENDPAFLPGLAWTISNLGNRYADSGRRADAAVHAEESTKRYRELANDNPAFRGDLARTLSCLGLRYSQVARRAEAVACAEEAVALCGELADNDPQFRCDLAWALTQLGNRYSEAGRTAEAVVPSEQAVQLLRELADDDPQFRCDLAWALTQLGNRYSEAGRTAEAVVPSEQAVELYASLADQNPAVVPDLATAKRGLGGVYSGLLRHVDAIEPLESAVELYETLAAENLSFSAELALSLGNLGVGYSNVGRRTDAVAPTERAVELYETLLDTGQPVVPELAWALDHLGNRYSEVGRPVEALACCEKAIELYETAASEDSLLLPGLATASSHLGLRYGDMGRWDEAVRATERAVELLRELSDADPVLLPEFAGVLSNLGISYSEAGRWNEAIEVTETAVDLYEGLAAKSPAYRPALAMALANLGIRQSELGRLTEALQATQRAYHLYEQHATDNPGFVSDLAATSNSLGKRYNELGFLPEAMEATEKAVELYLELAADNPVFLFWLADSLHDLTDRYRDNSSPMEPNSAWSRALDSLPTASARAGLLIEKTHREQLPTAVDDLLHALGFGSALSGDVLFRIHQLGRMLRKQDSELFDTEWQRHRSTFPAWLCLEETILEQVADWLQTATYAEAREYHRAHADVLAKAEAHIALDELALLQSDPAIIEQHRPLLIATSERGADAVYLPLVLADLVRASLAEQLRQVDNDPGLFLGDEAADLLRQRVDSSPDDAEIERCEAFVNLARNGLQHEAVAAAGRPAELPDFLAKLLATGRSRQLPDAARFLLHTNLDDKSAAETRFYLAIGLVESGRPEQAKEQLETALRLDPGSSLRWADLLARQETAPPQLATLLPPLLANPQATPRPNH